MATISILVDTDIFIDYFNTGRFSAIFDSTHFTVYYSVVTKKELLSKLVYETLSDKPSSQNWGDVESLS